MHVEGMANIRVCANNIQATLRVAVSSELKENMLISCDDLRKLRVIPADFPNAVLAVQQSNKLSHLKAKLMQRFDSTLSDDLNPALRCQLHYRKMPHRPVSQRRGASQNTMNLSPRGQSQR